ncbi:predicted protein [Histoplasma capsulatum var. duboisii H88]|uniref:Predicted protein n=1 Tax=Ajellomyces capsulatus (strain H88) TaxID=544711 RepID=F0UJD2_AJEC8|nr:predicted protein [Histoplasma capsulatum var. duboisii H88]
MVLTDMDRAFPRKEFPGVVSCSQWTILTTADGCQMTNVRALQVGFWGVAQFRTILIRGAGGCPIHGSGAALVVEQFFRGAKAQSTSYSGLSLTKLQSFKLPQVQPIQCAGLAASTPWAYDGTGLASH